MYDEAANLPEACQGGASQWLLPQPSADPSGYELAKPNELSIDGTPPDVWTIGEAEDVGGKVSYTALRTLSDEDVAEYEEAVTFLLERQQNDALRLVVGNYRECRALEAALSATITASSMPYINYERDYIFNLGRILLNWLTSIRLFDDHTRTRLTHTYGESSTELGQFEKTRAKAYDGNASYRFFCQLRNYAQHCGAVPIQVKIHVTADTRGAEIYFDRDRLLRDFDNWK